MSEKITNQPRPTPDRPASNGFPMGVSPLALGGLVLGIGVLEAEEVMRYLDQAFQRHAQEEMPQTTKS